MTHIAKPRVRHPGLPTNELGLTRRDYEGSMSTLCAGCGHDSITAAVIQAAWSMSLEPHRVAKLSGIGCSSKTPTYFIGEAHGFNAVHGRMPSIATGAQAVRPDLTYIGVSGDGDSLAIGIGQLCHAIRRNVDMLYLLENNGVYGLTKGQFSASADVGSKAKKGRVNRQPPIDPLLLALGLGATFVARGFSGDKAQLVPIIEAGIRHEGFAFVDVVSPCVAFNDHEGSTKSYRYTREHLEAAVEADLVLPMAEITTSYDPGTAREVPLPDGSSVLFRKVPEDYDPEDRDQVDRYIRARQAEGEIPTGLLYVDPDAPDHSETMELDDRALADVPWEELCPGSGRLEEVLAGFR
ncbi:MAG: 2-oxoacid:ferredoxin oxidoreductase subunit beta [Gemmatimonadota bacterium]|nr:2-oxoacid:ferredoxin oxidoreductase subunit beta [Gemmatimonadota bacterium]